VVLHYHEVALKGRNRPFFESRLVRHLRLLLRDLGVTGVDALPGRLRIVLPESTSWEAVRERLQSVFGIANYSLAHAVPITDDRDQGLALLKTAVSDAVRDIRFETFRVSTKRGDKRFPLTSMDVDRAIGTHVEAVTGKRVQLKRPDLTIYIETLRDQAYVAVTRVPGPGGLPVGISGKVACLISGGIDSPVAAYRMIKRGCQAVFVHFHGRPYVSRASEDKVREIVETLTRCQLQSRLYLIPFGDIQRQIVLGAPAAHRVVLYRRMMVRIAEEIAARERCWALVTGDSLGQVASQTAENLSVVEEAAGLPVLRPLIGMDKVEITEQAQRIGTFETSIEPDQDCCSLFVPAHPSTRTVMDDIRKIERHFDLTALAKQGLDQMEVAQIQFPRR
ncbi:MAG TPA: tRNA uracil 4-sulfurtransferase ThiI, partial [Nitrospirales bacterium]|nr:tRNA uracil 4-sulfurtransferase ThiI [Nitrospirales bacterium]